MELRDKNGLTEAEFLAAYRPGKYPHPSVTADIAVFRAAQAGEGVELLLIRRGGHPCLGRFALPGGFAEPGESVDETAARELSEETGLTGLPLEPVGLFSTPCRDPRDWVITQAYATCITWEQAARVAAADARWFAFSAEEQAGVLTLTFTAGDLSFSAALSRRRLPRLRGGLRSEFSILRDGGLAFDHACIIATAADCTGLLPD